MLSYIVRACIL